MVAITAAHNETSVQLCSGLSAEDSARVTQALAFVQPAYLGRKMVTGQDALAFSLGVGTVLASLKTDADTRIAGLLFELAAIDSKLAESIEGRFGKEVAD